MRMIAGMGLVLLTAGCTSIAENSQRASDTTRAALYNTTERFQEYLSYQPEDKRPQAPQTAYCYDAMGDIICYDSPKPFISNKLTGYQGYSAPAVPSTVVRAPANATVTTMPVMVKPVAAETAMVDASASTQQEVGSPQTLMPRY